MKRSRAPIFWLLFGAGGMFAALLGVAMVWVTGLEPSLHLLTRSGSFDYSRVAGFTSHVLVKLFLFAAASLFAWHAAHRIFHSLHDVGLPNGTFSKLLCYGTAFGITLVSGASVLSLG